jgi:hypothetical protein
MPTPENTSPRVPVNTALWEDLSLTEHRTPPGGLRGRGRIHQVLGPEQPLTTIREAHVHGQVLLGPVMSDNLADRTTPLGNPVVLAHPHRHADERDFRFH